MEFNEDYGTQPFYHNRMASAHPQYMEGRYSGMIQPYSNESYYPGYPMGQGWSGMPHTDEQMPYYMAYPHSLQMQDEEDDERDMERLKGMFPNVARRIQPLVEDECDKMEYDGSLMFDVYPDKLMTEAVIQRVYQKVQSSEQNGLEREEITDDEIFATNCHGCNSDRGPDLLQDLVSVMLFQEMHRRRCRRRRCKKWW